MLKHWFAGHLALGLAQAVLAASVALVVMYIARRRGIHLEKEISLALVRGIVQITAVGTVLVLLLRGPHWTGGVILLAMIFAAAMISARRVRAIPQAWKVSLYAILAGAGSVIALMSLAGVIDSAITALVPVGSMLIANAMNANSLALERFRSDVQAHVGQIEAALALGAASQVSVFPYAQASFRASIIPAIDSLRSLGIVWIPGLMAGMVLSGSPPVYAAVYQFVVIAMIFSSSSLTCLVSTSLVRQTVFSGSEQLLLRASMDLGR